jgi:sugar lactone lactonase YvrE
MRVWVVCLVLVTTACASAGTKVDPNTVASFIKGRTTVAEVQDALGEANGSATRPDGSTVLVYTHARTSVRASTFIPIVGGFVGGADSKSQSVVLRFAPDGTYLDATSATGNVGAGMGLSAQ